MKKDKEQPLPPPELKVTVGHKELVIFLAFCIVFISIGIGVGFFLFKIMGL